MKDTALETKAEISASIWAQMAADRAPVYHDHSDFQLVPFSIPFSSSAAHATNVPTGPACINLINVKTFSFV